MCTWLVQEVADQSPAARPLRRRAGLLIGQWVGKLKGEDRPMAYRALLSLLADSDPAMQLAAVASLHALIDDWLAPHILDPSLLLSQVLKCSPHCWKAPHAYMWCCLYLADRYTLQSTQFQRKPVAHSTQSLNIAYPWLDYGEVVDLLALAGLHKLL